MPIEQLANAINFYAFYTNAGVRVVGLTVTVDIYEVTRAGAQVQSVNNGACTEIGDGLYFYRLTGPNVDETGEYPAVFNAVGGAVDAVDMASSWTIGRAGVENLDAAISDVPAGVWSYVPRTLTTPGGGVLPAEDGGVVNVYQYNTWVIALTGLGSLVGRSLLYFTAKEDVERADGSQQTILQVEETAGLIWIGGEAASNPALGTLVVNDAAAGDITITVDETVTGIVSMDGRYDVKMVTAAGVASVLSIGTFHVLEVVTRAVT